MAVTEIKQADGVRFSSAVNATVSLRLFTLSLSLFQHHPKLSDETQSILQSFGSDLIEYLIGVLKYSVKVWSNSV